MKLFTKSLIYYIDNFHDEQQMFRMFVVGTQRQFKFVNIRSNLLSSGIDVEQNNGHQIDLHYCIKIALLFSTIKGAIRVPKGSPRLKRTIILFAVVWTAIILAIVGWGHLEGTRDTLELARVQGNRSYEKDLMFRRWVAGHGGVYVPVTEETPLNPYLSHIENRDVTTTSGLELTLMNPAYVTRQVYELEREQYGYSGHLTSRNPTRPENAPDAWEEEALRKFERGETEVVELTKIGNAEYQRLMRPLIVEERCLKCHAAQGYVVGDIRGGLSVTEPIEPLRSARSRRMTTEAIGFGLLWMLGLGGMGFGALRINRRIRDLVLTEEKLRESEGKYRDLVETSHDMIWRDDLNGRFVFLNAACERTLGYALDDMLGHRFSEFKAPELSEQGKEMRRGIIASDAVVHYETRYIAKSGKTIHLSVNALPWFDKDGKVGGTQGTAHDISERKRAEEEKARLEEQYIQAQKMESIGRLAGGVAHDFNNLLTTISGYAEMIESSLDSSDPLSGDVKEILKASDSAARLTSQLLAFSRKQTIDPKVVDINEKMERSQKMLKRLIEEDIDLLFVPDKDLWRAKIDPGQLDQILLNLTVNAHDAMPKGGKLTIETANVAIDEAYCVIHQNAKPGEFVMLAVSDDGCGMEKEVLDDIFEPFFTTKQKEEGTGLGLAMVYGIVKQHGGFINAYSEPDQGTSIKIYLPRVRKEVSEIGEHVGESKLGGTEMVLLAEDEDQVRGLATRILKENGYRVLEANNGGDAYLKCKGYEEEIHLLVTDVVMPEMNGKELYELIAPVRPGIKVLYLSGYTDNAIAHRGVLEEGTSFLQKPFRAAELLRKVREALQS